MASPDGKGCEANERQRLLVGSARALVDLVDLEKKNEQDSFIPFRRDTSQESRF
jgi:hypothetical protein